MESMPFWEMDPHNELVREGSAFCLAKPGTVYAFYLPSGGEIRVELPENSEYECKWWNAGNSKDSRFEHKQRVDGGDTKFSAPGEGDWALLVTRA